jgi:hypothetical protein
VIATRPTGPIVVALARHRDIRTSGRGIATNIPGSWTLGRAAKVVTRV